MQDWLSMHDLCRSWIIHQNTMFFKNVLIGVAFMAAHCIDLCPKSGQTTWHANKAILIHIRIIFLTSFIF